MLTFEEITTRETWARFAPGFHIGDEARFRAAPALELGANRREELMGQLVFDGYFQESGLDWGLDVAAMAAAVRAVSAAGLLPVFAFVFDEFWLPFRKLRLWYAGLLGDYAFMPDFWAWNLEPRRGDVGWPPHRDKGHYALAADGTPKALTTWIALSRAEPLNGCMYIVPASCDPVYGTPSDNEIRFDLQSVRALPAAAGDVLMWNQSVLHWGGRTAPRATESRVSIAFEFQRADIAPYNKVVLKPDVLPGFEARLALIAQQILQYPHARTFDAATLAIARRLAG
ncbi:MAG TPA: phytanoyl-CoA dioxygenase family protein [Rhizomicrobium sp.]|nr:phytanoyl-CoA dioxygenase family protein [Rhizomicrobium sp.]